MRITILTALFTLGTLPAQALTTLVATPGGQASPGEGMVTARAGTVEERFNTALDLTTCVAPSGIGIDLVGGAGDVYDLANDSVVNKRMLPTSDASCYLTLGSARISDNLEIDFTSSASTPLTYLGFYWGSMDEYNGIAFFNASGPVEFAGGLGSQLTGDVVASQLGVPVKGSTFVEFDLDPADQVTYAYFSSENYAFEIDNIAYTLGTSNNVTASSVAEPRALALSGFGFAMLTAGRRRRSR